MENSSFQQVPVAFSLASHHASPPVSAAAGAHDLNDGSGAPRPIIDWGIPALGAHQASILILPGKWENEGHSVRKFT